MMRSLGDGSVAIYAVLTSVFLLSFGGGGVSLAMLADTETVSATVTVPDEPSLGVLSAEENSTTNGSPISPDTRVTENRTNATNRSEVGTLTVDGGGNASDQPELPAGGSNETSEPAEEAATTPSEEETETAEEDEATDVGVTGEEAQPQGDSGEAADTNDAVEEPSDGSTEDTTQSGGDTEGGDDPALETTENEESGTEPTGDDDGASNDPASTDDGGSTESGDEDPSGSGDDTQTQPGDTGSESPDDGG